MKHFALQWPVTVWVPVLPGICDRRRTFDTGAKMVYK